MHYLRSAVLTFIILTVVLFFASCGGGSSSSVGPITSITLSPSPALSLNGGDTFQMTASATDARGRAVNNQTLTFNSSNTSVAQIATGGNLPGIICAGGVWKDGQGNTSDGLANPVVCASQVPPPAAPVFNSGTTNITVTAQGVTSNAVTVNVHPKVARVVLTASQNTCASQTGQISFTAQALDANGIDITSSVGGFNWSIADSTVGTLAYSTTPGPNNLVTAVLPGITTVTASINSTNPVNSPAVVFQECPVASITITGPNTNPNLAFNPSPGAIGATGQLSAVVKDSLGAVVNNVTLTWNSSVSAAATVNSTGLVAGVAYGTSNITASCAVNGSCNKGQGSVVNSNTVTASVGPGATGTTVYATGSGTTSLVPISNTTNTAGTAITLPANPNSLVFDPQGANAYLGSSTGLMVVNATNNTLTKQVSNAPGIVLAVSPNGQLVFIGGANYTTLLFNSSANTVTTLSTISNAVAADFSPDSSEAIVVNQNTPATPATSTSTVYAVQGATVRTVATLPAPGASDVSFLPNGGLAYVANSTTPLVTVCNNASQAGSSSLLTTKLKGIADPTNPSNPNIMLGANSPNIAVMTPTLTAACPPGITETRAQVTTGGSFTANQIIVTPDSKHAYIPANDVSGKLLSYDVVGNATGAVTLVGTAPFATTGGVTLDSASVYVGVSDNGNTTGSVHQIAVASGTDVAQISVSFIPDLVAVRPH